MTAIRNGEAAIWLGLGSNLGDREAHLAAALLRLDHPPDCRLIRCSSLYESAPWGVVDQPPFLNAACQVESVLRPHALLEYLKAIEGALGRDFSAPRWGPRIIDIDILLFRDEVLDDPNLVIPHPRLAGRLFALIPMLELDPGLKDPLTGATLASYRDQLLAKESGNTCLPWNPKH